MLHTITDEFLQDSYPVTRDSNVGAGSSHPVKAHQRFSLEPNEFRLKLARKINELRMLEVSDSQIIKELNDSQASSKGSMPMMGTIRGDASKRHQDKAEENQLFMTFLQHGDTSKLAKTKQDLANERKGLLKKTLTKDYDRSSGEMPMPT